jgi:ATP-binding cassette subfamily B protein
MRKKANNKKRQKKAWNTLTRIFSYMSGMKLKLFIVIIFCIMASFTEIIGVFISQIIIDEYILPLSQNYNEILFQKFAFISLILFAIYIMGNVVPSIIHGSIMANITASVTFKLRNEMFVKMQKASIKYFNTNKHGDIMSTYTNDIFQTQYMIERFNDFIIDIFMTITNFTIMIYYSWKLTLISCLSLSIIYIIVRQISIKSRILYKIRLNKLAELNAFIEEVIDGQKVVKIFNHEKQIENDFDKYNNTLYSTSVKANNFSKILSPILFSISTINQSIIVFLSLIMVVNQQMTIGIAIVFFNYTRKFFFPINNISHYFSIAMNGMAGAERIFKIVDGKEEINEGKITLNKNKLNGVIEFKNVVFGYDNKKTILDNVSIKAEPSKKIAIVGSTGAGKTTIINLINRFYDINSGTITIDNMNIQDIRKESLRSNITTVLQDTNLFTASVMENIRYGRLDATDDDVYRVAKLSNADYFIQHLPETYNTLLTENGNRLSQGEKQLLNIARAMINNTQILILDEATSSIDTRTEKLIEEAMNRLMAGKTTFIIAHRLSTVRNSDTILVMEDGEIIEKGSHNELLSINGKYWQLYNGMVELN